eukprot:8103610-Ditylum_brightwellii.AAC.1
MAFDARNALSGRVLGVSEHSGKSETEAIIFAAPGKHYNDYDTSPVTVANGYITYTKTFKYLGSMLSWDLNDRPDLENRALQARKSLQVMMPHVFCNPTISLK